MANQTEVGLRRGPSSDELLRLVVESASDFAIIATDRRGVVTSWNPGAARLLGYTEEEISGRDGDIIFTAEDRAADAPERERLKALAKGRAINERWHRRKDSSRFWGSGLMMPLTDGSGFVKIMRDLTERREAQKRLRESEQLFRLLATNVPQLVFRTRPDGGRTWGSPQWIAFTGVSFENSLGFGWLDAIHPEDRQATVDAWADARRAGAYYMEHRIKRSSDGEYRWHQTRAQLVESDMNGDGDWVGTSTDVHEMRGLQERQKVLLAELQHRTRNLLAVVQGIERKTIRTSKSLDDFATDFENRLRALSGVQDLLARIDHGSIDIRALVDSELSAHGDGNPETGKVTISGPPAQLSAASAQAIALGIHELATNAVKYGALKQEPAKLFVAWDIESDNKSNRRVLVLDWIESGVTMPEGGVPPTHQGYGMQLIERALPYQLRASTKLEFSPDGVHCRIVTPVEPGTPDG